MDKSEELKKDLKNKLNLISNDFDELYYSIRRELEQEILNRKEKIEKIKLETNEVYDELTIEKCIDLIKSRLPLRVKLFNKVKYGGKGIPSNDHILIGFYLNNSYNCFEYTFTISEIKRILKIK